MAKLTKNKKALQSAKVGNTVCTAGQSARALVRTAPAPEVRPESIGNGGATRHRCEEVRSRSCVAPWCCLTVPARDK